MPNLKPIQIHCIARRRYDEKGNLLPREMQGHKQEFTFERIVTETEAYKLAVILLRRIATEIVIGEPIDYQPDNLEVNSFLDSKLAQYDDSGNWISPKNRK